MKKNIEINRSTLSLIAVLLLLLVLNTLSALGVFALPRLLVISVYILLPALILFFSKTDKFLRIKLATLVFGAVLYAFALFGVIDSVYIMLAFVWLSRINIVEAVITDFIHGSYLNAINGTFVVLALAKLIFVWDGVSYTAILPSLGAWILAYTLWNFNFVVGRYGPAVALYHTSVLLSPILGIALLKNEGYWFFMRGFTLNAGVAFHIAFEKSINRFFDTKMTRGIQKIVQTKGVQWVIALMVAICSFIVLLSG